MLNSVWTLDTKLPDFPPLIGNVKTDVAIIGGGMAAQDCMTLDGAPYIGRYGRHTPDVFLATGNLKKKD